MSTGQEKEYDESDAIRFIIDKLPEEIKNKYSDDDILIVIDTIFDYYDDKGFLDINAGDDDELELSTNDLVSYVKNQIRKDTDNVIEMDDVKDIVLGELQYEESLEMN